MGIFDIRGYPYLTCKQPLSELRFVGKGETRS